MKVLYFAWVRERTGLAEEDVTPPDGVTTVGELISWLISRGPEYESAFENASFIRAALDQEHVDHDTPLNGAREIAFFPPMTGG
ncbi:MAG: molybdopterin converting factor subunit 1 [Fimbriimonadaceae bacterium]|nr:molybdopterin converting factor subunit 1 [Alphaproteobacteria bacterium]